MFAIESVSIAKTYGSIFGRKGQEALKGVDLHVPVGTAFGLIGPNGAGKTTFIKTLLGVVRPTSGTVKVLGGVPTDPAVRARIGYLPERLQLPSAWKPVPFLRSVARLKGMHPTSGELVRQLERVGLGPDTHRKIGGFSKGMRQRLGLAAALLGSPELLVLDEPTDGVDPLGRVEIRRIMAEEIARGATLFLNSHLLSETERICNRVGILSGGRLLREGPLDELRASKGHWRVRFAPGTAAQVAAQPGWSATSTADVFFCDAVDPSALNVALDGVRQTGALLVELSRDAQDLEQIFAQVMGAAA